MRNSARKDILIVSFALFSMFFGAGNVIFPPYLGLISGKDFLSSALGFAATGAGLPILGIIAIAKSKNFDGFANKVFPAFAAILGSCIMIAIGPLLAIPKTAALTYEIGIVTLLPGANKYIAIALFFLVTLFFSLNSTSAIDKLGSILTPVLLISLTILIVKGVLDPIGIPQELNFEQGFANGFVEGYQTMDALASIMFAVVIIKSISEKGYTGEKLTSMTSITGVIAGLGLALIYFGLLYMGACASEHVSPDITKSEMVIYLAKESLGDVGKIILSSIIGLACLTTSIGLTTTAGEYFENLSGKKLSYKIIVILTCIVSCLIAYMGVDKIVGFSAPILSALYPTTIVLIIFNVLNLKNHFVYKFSCIPVLIFTIITVLISTFASADTQMALKEAYPFLFHAFVWLPLAIVGSVVGYIISKFSKQ